MISMVATRGRIWDIRARLTVQLGRSSCSCLEQQFEMVAPPGFKPTQRTAQTTLVADERRFLANFEDAA